MSDYIKREDAINVVSSLVRDEESFVREYAIDRIKRIPTADVVEVVRCKDCKHYIKSKRYGMMCEILVHAEQGDNFYCGYGERKDNEKTISCDNI